MGILFEELTEGDEVILKDLENVCLTEGACGTCEKEQCLVGYAQQSLLNCLKNNVTYVENGMDRLPVNDLKIYREEDLAAGIANILKTCRSGGENHYENCIINVLRSCYEVALFGEEREYEGSAFSYLTKLQSEEKTHSGLVLEYYSAK